MVINLLLHKTKSLILLIVNVFRRALCCFRKARSSLSDSEPLTHVVSSQDREGHSDLQPWETGWNDENIERKPKTIQDHIDLYRKQSVKAKADLEEKNPEEDLNFFENMTPRITKQTKILIKNEENQNTNVGNRLNFVADRIDLIPSGELEEWEEETGWDGDSLEKDARQVLREQKRLARERKALERLDKGSRSLGSRLST